MVGPPPHSATRSHLWRPFILHASGEDGHVITALRWVLLFTPSSPIPVSSDFTAPGRQKSNKRKGHPERPVSLHVEPVVVTVPLVVLLHLVSRRMGGDMTALLFRAVSSIVLVLVYCRRSLVEFAMGR